MPLDPCGQQPQLQEPEHSGQMWIPPVRCVKVNLALLSVTGDTQTPVEACSYFSKSKRKKILKKNWIEESDFLSLLSME